VIPHTHLHSPPPPPPPHFRYIPQEFFGALFNEEKESRRATLIKEKRWDCIANKVERKWNENVFNDIKDRVCWTYYLPDDWGYGRGWVWSNECGGENEDYYCKLATECHAKLGTGPGNKWFENIIDHETTAEMFQDCDAIIYSSYYRNLANGFDGEEEDRKIGREKALSVLKSTKAWKNSRVFDTTKSGPSNYYESRIVHYGEEKASACFIACLGNIAVCYVRIYTAAHEFCTLFMFLISPFYYIM